MRSVIYTAATFKPVSVEEVKSRPEMRISGTGDNGIIDDMIDLAVEEYRKFTGNVMCSSVWKGYMDSFPVEIETPGPLSAVTSITYYDTAGDLQTLSSDVYKLDTYNPVLGRIALKYGQSWPSVYDEINSVIVNYTSGYANPAAIPAGIKQGLFYKIQELYYGGDLSAIYEGYWSNYCRKQVF